jgi:SAM-dependent methyltransferase
MNRDALTAQDWFDLFFRQYSPISRDSFGDSFNYFFHRFTQPRQLAALLLVNSLSVQGKPLLDLACGFGHLGHNLAESPARHSLVGVDRNFFQLWMAQYWIAPKNRFVCANADQRLPFADESFSAVLCSDAFHYFRDKVLAVGEIVRCAKDQPVLLMRVGNRLVEPNEGFELTPQEYVDLFGGPGWRMFGERELLEQYLQREQLDLSTPQAAGVVDDEKWISFVHPGVPPRMSAMPDSGCWPHSVGRLGINPIYTIARLADGNWRLQFKFPSDHYVFENFLLAYFHPQQVTVTYRYTRQHGASTRR